MYLLRAAPFLQPLENLVYRSMIRIRYKKLHSLCEIFLKEIENRVDRQSTEVLPRAAKARSRKVPAVLR